MKHGLFREIATQNRGKLEYGSIIDVKSVTPLILAVALLGMFCVLVALGFFTSYSKKTVVKGVLDSNKGIALSYSREEGVVEEVFVSVGESVKKGQVLFKINTGHYSGLDTLSYEDKRSGLFEQKDELIQQIDAHKLKYEIALSELNQSVESNREELQYYKNRLDIVLEKNDILFERFTSAKSLSVSGNISIDRLSQYQLDYLNKW